MGTNPIGSMLYMGTHKIIRIWVHTNLLLIPIHEKYHVIDVVNNSPIKITHAFW